MSEEPPTNQNDALTQPETKPNKPAQNRPNRLRRLLAIATFGLVGAGVGVAANAVYGNDSGPKANSEPVPTSVVPAPETTSTTLPKKILAPRTSTSTSTLPPQTAPRPTAPPPAPPPTPSPETQPQKPWEIAAYKYSHPQVGDNIDWLIGDIIIKPGAVIFDAPSLEANQLEVNDLSGTVKRLVVNPEAYRDEEGKEFIYFVDEDGRPMFTNDFANVRILKNRQEEPFSPGAAALAGSRISFVDELNRAYVTDTGTANLTEHGVRIAQTVPGFTDVLGVAA